VVGGASGLFELVAASVQRRCKNRLTDDIHDIIKGAPTQRRAGPQTNQGYITIVPDDRKQP
jgi:hypothetical protein